MTTHPMTTEAIQSLANFNKYLSGGCPCGLHNQGNIEARVAFLEKNVPTLQMLRKHYLVGEMGLHAIINRVASGNYENLDESQAKVDAILSGYRSRIAELQAEAYAHYVRIVQKHNDKARHDRRMKAKEAISLEAFVSKMPTF